MCRMRRRTHVLSIGPGPPSVGQSSGVLSCQPRSNCIYVPYPWRYGRTFQGASSATVHRAALPSPSSVCVCVCVCVCARARVCGRRQHV